MAHNRAVKNWVEERADAFPVAPHRYTWDREGNESLLAAPGIATVKEWRMALPYKPGDVIMVKKGDKAVRAKVLYVVLSHDSYGDRQAVYQCAVETVKGTFSKVWQRFYPGHVQRGYYLAGLAPDLEGKL